MWTSPYEPIAATGTLLVLIRAAAGRSPGRTAFVDAQSGQAVTYATLVKRIDRVASGLVARGFTPGSVLALQAPNMPPWMGVALGTMAAGGVLTGISILASEREISAQLADARASILVTVPALIEPARRAAETTGLDEIFVVGEAPGAKPITALLAETGPAPEIDLSPEQVALLPYSSGTTGQPKGVMLTHRNLAAAVRQVGCGLAPSERDTLLVMAPFAHVMGFIIAASALSAGATVLTLPRFEIDAFLAALERHRVTLLVVPPPIMAALAHHPAVASYDLSALELIVSGGAPLSADLQRQVAARFPHAAVGQGYGMTETAVGIAMLNRRGSTPGSVGRLMPSTQLRVIDPDTGHDLGPGEPGELWARGPQVMAGYLNRPEATADILDSDGWLRTGDLGYLDAEGNVFIIDRLKELIKVNALQVAPAELEALLLARPDVADAAVIPRPDPRTGEVPVAVIVPRGPINPDELMAWVAGQVAPHKRIRAVRLVEAIPRTPSGKILRRALVDADRGAEAPNGGNDHPSATSRSKQSAEPSSRAALSERQI